jgi:soluble lytic murein transglycosylase-like protein
VRRCAAGVVAVLLAAGAAAAGERVAGVMTFVDRDGAKRIVSVPTAARTVAVPTGSADRRGELWPHVQEVARAQGLDPNLVDLMIRMESGYNPRAVSPKGARGIMQLLPSTANAYGVNDIFDPKENLRGGIRYFRDLLGRFGADLRLALAAYNAGPDAVEKHHGIPPYTETRNYVNSILSAYNGGGLQLGGGFGKLPAKPARPVEVVTQGNETLISNARRAGETTPSRRLGLR